MVYIPTVPMTEPRYKDRPAARRPLESSAEELALALFMVFIEDDWANII